MAIRNIKEIIDNKGYIISQTDREIFQDGDLQSFFGLSDYDAIEFIIYDANDNQLPQENFGLVRYIRLSTENIRDYFLVADGTRMQFGSLPSEYFIDAERLIRESGYNNGIFKVQITLINKRVGSEAKDDKLWIQSISPSRTEVRVRPLERRNTPVRLRTTFDILFRSSNFREDVIIVIDKFLQQISALSANDIIMEKYSETWVNRLLREFKIPDIAIFLTQIREKFTEASGYEFSNRISDITHINYGKFKDTEPLMELSVTQVEEKCKNILLQCINYYLPQQDIRTDPEATLDNNASVDEVERFAQTRTEQSFFDVNVSVEQTTRLKPTRTSRERIVFDVVDDGGGTDPGTGGGTGGGGGGVITDPTDPRGPTVRVEE